MTGEETRLLKDKFAFRVGGKFFDNVYYETGWCPNCGDRDPIVIRKGVPKTEVELICRRCEAAKLIV